MAVQGTGQIPEKLINYKMYVDGAAAASALVDATLPSIEFLTETINGAGIAGEIESPTIGHTQAMTTELNVRTILDADFSLIEPKSHQFEFRAAQQSTVQSTGAIEARKLSVVMKTTPLSYDLGTLAVGAPTDGTLTFSVTYLKIEYEEKKVLEIDKVNMIYNVNGKDYLHVVRNILGI